MPCPTSIDLPARILPSRIELEQVREGLLRVRERIEDAAARFGRCADDIQLLAVSKVQPATKIIAAVDAGQTAFGESYVQEALDKQLDLRQTTNVALDWHFIGRVQTNKTRDIAAYFSWVHGLSEIKHARRLGRQRLEALGDAAPPLACCLQVNLSGEASKSGIAPELVPEFLAECTEIAGIEVRGLMTLPAPSDDLHAQREPFAELRRLRDDNASDTLPLPTLSMGMSTDLEAAIAEGATMVRVGAAVFGPRPQL